MEDLMEDLQNDFKKNSWALVGQSSALITQPPAGTRTIEVESVISLGKTLRRWICYYPEKVAASVIVWGNHRQKTIELQQRIKCELVYEFKSEPKGVFIRKLI